MKKPIGGPCPFCGVEVSAGYLHETNCPGISSESTKDVDEIMKMYLRVDMPDGTQWDVPVITIARNRAKYYAGTDEFAGFIDALYSDTIPAFLDDEYEIEDWAANNMDWEEVEHVAIPVKVENELNNCVYQEGWVNGYKEVISGNVPVSQPEKKYSDTQLLDFLQKKLDEKRYSGKIVCRWSKRFSDGGRYKGRGIRLHETSREDAVSDVREAIINFIKGDTPLETPGKELQD